MTKSEVPGTVRHRVFERDGYRCKTCGLQGWRERFPRGGYGHPTRRDGVFLSIDHIVPRSKGGPSEEGNLQTLCTRCNTAKGVKLMGAA